MKKFEKAYLELIRFGADVIVTSDAGAGGTQVGGGGSDNPDE